MPDTHQHHSGEHGKPQDKQKRLHMTPSTFVLIVGLVAVGGFAVGTRSDQIISMVAPTFGIKVEAGTLDLSSVQNTYRKLSLNFDGKLDSRKLIEGASRGLVAASGDIHTEYFDGKEAGQFNDSLNGKIGGGIGAEIGLRDNKPTVIRVLDGAPAGRGGVLGGDSVLEVNDEDVTHLTVDQTVQKIRGAIGTTVKLTVSRKGQTKDFTLTREEITSPSVVSKVDGDIGILTISRFDDETASTARAAAEQLKAQNVKKIILDLRDNGGGVLQAAPDVVGLWLNDKLVVSERKDGKTLAEQRTGNEAILAGIPTVVLVNGGTASASEITTAALKEHGVATVIGQKTYGKGTVQTVLELDNGAVLKVTIQRWFTPKGNNVDGKGIQPDTKVDLTPDDINASRDPQLDAAKAFLNK